MDRPYGGKIPNEHSMGGRRGGRRTRGGYDSDSEHAPLRRSSEDSYDDRRRGGRRGGRRDRGGRSRSREKRRRSRDRSSSSDRSRDRGRRGGGRRKRRSSKDRSRSRDRTRRGGRDRRRSSSTESRSHSPRRRRGRGRDADVYGNLRRPDLTDASQTSRDDRGRTRGRGRGNTNRRDRSRRKDQRYEEFDTYKGRPCNYAFQYGNFGNALQVLLFGVAPGPALPGCGCLVGMKLEGTEASKNITRMPIAYDKDEKRTSEEMQNLYKGNQYIRDKTASVRKDFVSRLLLHAMVWMPLIDFVVDLIIMIAYFRGGWLILYSIVLIYTCRSGLIGYFLHSMYNYTLHVNFDTIINTLIPFAWGRANEVYHDYIFQLEITAWLGFIQWPIRLGLQSWMTYIELKGGPKRHPQVGDFHLDMLQLSVVNAIARPVPMALIQFIGYNQGFLPFIFLVISAVTGVLNFWWLLFQNKSNGAVRGLQAVKQRTLLQPAPKKVGTFTTEVTCMDWAPDGKSILAGFSDGNIHAMRFAVKEGKPFVEKAYFEIGAHNQEKVNDCNFSSNGEFAVTCGDDGDVCLWHTSQTRNGLDPRTDWKIESSHKEHRKARVLKAKFSPTMQYVASGCEDGDLIIWDWDHQTRDDEADHCDVHQLSRSKKPGPGDQITMIGWDDMGTRCVACTRQGRCIEVTVQGQRIRDIDFRNKGIVSMGSVGHNTLLKLGQGNNINMDETKQDNTAKRFVAVLCIQNSEQNMKQVTEIVVRDIYDGKTLRKMCLPHGNPVGFVAICKDKMHCVTAATSAKLWNMQTGECIGSGQKNVEHWETLGKVTANCGAIHPNGRWVMLGSKNGQITAFDFSNWRYTETHPRKREEV